MTEDLSLLWKNVLTDVKLAVSQANYATLLKNTGLLSLDDTTATIAAPSAIIIDLLEKHCLSSIKDSLKKHLKKDVAVVFVPKTIFKQTLQNNGPLFAYPDEKEEPKHVQTIGHLPRVRSDYTFANLAVSSSNQLAFVSAQTVVKNLGHSYNPLFIYGPVGVGKTHLMQAIANDVYQKTPEKKIIYLTSEEFTNEVVEAIRSNDTARMKKKFRSCQLLIIDDVQFIAGKERVQEELFHTFNTLIDSGSQIVLSSDRPPQEIKKLENRLSSRFAGGLTVDVDSPDFELKTAILLIKAKKYSLDLSIEVAKIIAEKAEDTRSLEGLLLRVITEGTARGKEIDESLANLALKNTRAQEPQRLRPDDVINIVCDFYEIKPTLLKGPKRDARLVKARQVTMYLLKNELKLTFTEIGNLLGGRDHTTIMHGVEKIESLSSRGSLLSEDIVGIKKVFQQ